MTDLGQTLAQHDLGERIDVVGHACPECPLGRPAPFCEVCLGAGMVSTERLARHSAAAQLGL